MKSQGFLISINENGKISSIVALSGNDERLAIKYFGSGWGIKSEKVKSINEVLELDYYDEGWAGIEGKLKKVGSIKLAYWNEGFGAENEGKVKSLNGLQLSDKLGLSTFVPVDYTPLK